MQLHYFNESPNYGDALNPWFWPRLLSDRLQERSSTLFLAIGTILKPAERYVVLGSGGYKAFSQTDSHWTFYALRDPLTAQGLGINPELAVLDGAYLLRNVAALPPSVEDPEIGFMPHWQTRLSLSWEKIFSRSGLRDREANFRRTCRQTFSSLENKLQIRALIARLTALRKTFQGNLGLGHLSTDTVLHNQMQRLNRRLACLCEAEN